MGRKKSFNQQEVIAQMSQVFGQYGFEGTSLDDLVKVTGLLRGSLYSEFGSKQGMFIASLSANLENHTRETLTWRLLLVAMLELTPNNQAVREIVRRWYENQDSTDISVQLGQQLLNHSGILSEGDKYGKYN
ncbi:TetR/AcrR family transcriptional regulator [Leuconostoc sp. MS02]|uniref:TetR/AcrR family transcriptional regulator n=1 Tax=Leuconostoc aquikimchii TaxID=3236804 RepID=A0ABV3S2L4_9LACO